MQNDPKTAVSVENVSHDGARTCPETRPELPRGFSCDYRPGRPRPWRLRWRAEGRNRGQCFATRAELVAESRHLADARKEIGKPALEWSAAGWREYLAAKEACKGVPLLEALAEWHTLRDSGRAPSSEPTVAVAVERYMTARKAEGVTAQTLCHAKNELGRLVQTFGDMRLSAVTSDALRRWLLGLPFADVTKRNHYRRANALWNFAMRDGLTRANPWKAIRSPDTTKDEVSVLSAEDAAKLFATAQSARPEVLARLAMEAFAGIRFSSASVLRKEDVDFAARGIVLPAASIKTRRREYIEGLPDCLWAWLKAAPAAAWEITPRNYMRAKSDTFRLAGVENPGNVLRHSFASYHVAMNGDAARTAIILCHTSPAMLWRHYKGRATKAAAEKYFAVMPKRPKGQKAG